MSITVVKTNKAPSAVGTYSQGILFENTYFFSGQIGLDPTTGVLKESTKEQLEQILQNIDALLESQLLTRKNILKTTIFLTNLKEFDLVNKAYEEYFSTPYPARSCIEARALPKGASIEIEVIAGRF